MNADHGDRSKAFAGIEVQDAVMTSVDRLGFRLKVADTAQRRDREVFSGFQCARLAKRPRL